MMKAFDFELEDPGGRISTIAAATEGDAKHVDPGLRQYAHVRVEVAPYAGPESYRLEWQVLEETLPFPWMRDACVEGVKDAFSEPVVSGERIVLVKVSVTDGSYHARDTDAESVRKAARQAVRDALAKATLVPL